MLRRGCSSRLALAAALAALLGAAAQGTAAPQLPDDDSSLAHVLGRMGFGARPGDIETLKAMGVERYIEQQLHPEQIDDRVTESRVTHLATLRLSGGEINERYERPLLVARREQRAEAAAMPAPGAAGSPTPEMLRQPRPNAVAQAANTLMLELTEHKLLRAIYSERQLQEVLTDFWFNHFNVDSRKGRVRFLVTEYERDAIRPHVLGSFRELLGATAKSPAMLFYLDNFMSAATNPPAAARRPRAAGRAGRGGQTVPLRPQPAPQGRGRGLNENYGRELLELHTLGVDSGYTQKDVIEVARAFTGWTIAPPQQGGGFRFDPRMHDEGAKVVLGHRITAGGQRDGEQVLDILAKHPSTARFIATKLATRFVSDAPPPALVDRAAARFLATGGDLREVMRTILTSPEFFAPAAIGAKIKTPLEFVVSAVRATGVEVRQVRTLARSLQQMGMPLYQCQPPTGYKDTAEAWTNTGALLMRMNFALSLARQSGAAPRVNVDDLLHGHVSDATRTTIARATTGPQALALALGSPEFQKR